jgi:hypothetical protein
MRWTVGTHTSLISSLPDSERSSSRLSRFTLREGASGNRGWVGPGAGLDSSIENNLLQLPAVDQDFFVFQPVV